MHPSPELPKLEVKGNLKGIILVAPWVSFRMDFSSVKSNAHKDILVEHIGNKWSGDYMAGKDITPYANALVAESDWWKNSKVEHILCVAGGDEMIIDSVNEWVDKYKVSQRTYAIQVSTDVLVCKRKRQHHLRCWKERDPYRAHC